MWRKNLLILWIGTFLMMAGMNLIIPFLPLYLQELGVHDIHQVEVWAGITFAGTPLLSGILAPMWGRLSDRFGRKLMLIRSSCGMAVIMILIGFVQNPYELLLLRLLMGMVAGFIPTAYALQATITPEEHAGRTLGILQTGAVSGTMIGPLAGGVLSEWIGMRQVFFLTGSLQLLAAVVVIVGIHESRGYEKFSMKALFKPNPKFRRNNWGNLKDLHVLPLYLTSFLIFFAMQSIEPVITVYVQSMQVRNHLQMISGLVFAASGIGNILAAPFLGRLGDRIGNHKVLYVSLFMMVVFSIPQAFMSNPWSVLGLRFLSGLFVGGLVPSVNALLRKNAPADSQGSIFGFNQMANSLGAVAGPIFGGFVASHLGISVIFYFTSILFLLNCIWVRQSFRPSNAVEASRSFGV